MNRDIRKLTDGAMMAAIIGALLLIDRQMAGFISGTFLFLFPLPMVFYSAKYGLKQSLMVLAAVFILLFMLSTPQTMFFIGCESIIGMVYGSSIYSHTDNRRIVIRTLIMGALVELLAMVVFAAFFGIDLNMEVGEYKDMLNTLAPGAVDIMPNPDSTLKTMIVFAAALTGVLEGLITHMVSRMMLKRMRVPLPESKPIYLYYPPKFTGYLGLVGMLAYFYSMQKVMANELLQNVMQGLGMLGFVYLIAMGVIGLLIILPLTHPNLRKWTPLIVFALLFLAAFALAIFGFLYITTDLHERVLKGGKTDASEA